MDKQLHTVGELARQYRDAAALDAQREHAARARRINDLTVQRPIVLIDEVPWHEMDIDGQLTLTCEDPFLRGIEWHLRQKLFAWKHFPVDSVLLPYVPIEKTCRVSGGRLDVHENRISLDESNPIVSHEYIDQLADEEALEKLTLPTIEADAAADCERLARMDEALGGVLPARLTGRYPYWAAWDDISRYRGVSAILYDLADRPEFMHRIIGRMLKIHMSLLDQWEALGLLEAELPLLHCTPGYTDDLPAADYAGGPYRTKDVWIRGTAQIFASVSPRMHQEFELDYAKALFERCGLVYYGCCEPLDDKIHLLKRIPNMRKIGVSPWANVRACAEQIGGDYVLSRKPNPAHVAVATDEIVVAAEIRETLEACRDNNTPCEFVLKDISTVGYKPDNLIRWAEIVARTIDAFF